MRVEDIKDDKDVISFIRENYKPDWYNDWRYESYCGDIDSISVGSLLMHYYDSVYKDPTWFKMDINKDSVKDLVFCGCFQGNKFTLLFLSDIRRSYSVINLSTGEEQNIDNIKKLNDSIILFENFDHIYNNSERRNEILIRSDTICFSNGEVTEINSRNAYRKIDHIKINFGLALRYKSNHLIINRNGDIDLVINDKEDSGWVIKKYTLLNGSLKGKEILTIAETLPYYKYNDSYEFDVYDGFYWDTEIYFTNKTSIKVSDGNGAAPFGLRNIYNYAYRILHDKNLKIMSVKKDTTHANEEGK